MTYLGIDYGMGKTNINLETGIRNGVISQHSVNPDCLNDFEPDYGDPHCPECGGRVRDLSADPSEATMDGTQPDPSEDWPQRSHYGCADYACESCKLTLDSSECFPDEVEGLGNYDKDGYKLTDCLDSDIFVLDSPYYTYAQFCSPCVPGAGNLDSPMADGAKCYALGHDWFEGEIAPYPVWRVSDSAFLTAERTAVRCTCETGHQGGIGLCWRCNGAGFREEVVVTETSRREAKDKLYRAGTYLIRSSATLSYAALHVLTAAIKELNSNN